MIPGALCHGRGIPLCGQCLRAVDRYPATVVTTHRARITPTDTGIRCAAWLPAPAHAIATQPAIPAIYLKRSATRDRAPTGETRE